MNNPHKRTRPAFTIVGLLIVVVVIAILAAITIVAYNGITNQAKDSALKSDLSTTSKKLKLDKVDTGSFPSSKPSYAPDSIQYTGGGDSFCITASQDGKAFHMTQDGSIQDGACSGHTISGGESGGSSHPAGSMQAFTQSECTALPVYTGANPAALRTLTDARGGTTRSYTIGKLADNKCWMLDNLKLGSTTGSITLTPADSNVTANFTLPQVLIPDDDASYDDPQAIGPVPGDTGVGATNYGYLYNFPAATAGATRTSLPEGSSTAPSSICPANWRLPSSGYTNTSDWPPTGPLPANDFAQLDIAFGGTGSYVDAGQSNITRWQNSGPFKAVFSGGWWGSFDDQGGGASGYLWSRSAIPDSPSSAFVASFSSVYIYPGDDGYDHYNGLGVRCLLN